MFNFGIGEMLIIGAIALIFIGPRQLPQVARTIAKFMNEWRRATGDISRSLMETKDVVEQPIRDVKEQFAQTLAEEEEKLSQESGQSTAEASEENQGVEGTATMGSPVAAAPSDEGEDKKSDV